MEKHANYTEVLGKCRSAQAEFDKKHHEWIMEDSHQSEMLIKRKKRDIYLKKIKFVATVCNRIAFHMTDNGWVVVWGLVQLERDVVIDDKGEGVACVWTVRGVH